MLGHGDVDDGLFGDHARGFQHRAGDRRFFIARQTGDGVDRRAGERRQSRAQLDQCRDFRVLDQAEEDVVENLDLILGITGATGAHVHAEAVSTVRIAACAVCPAHQLSLCGEIRKKHAESDGFAGALPLTSTVHRIPARHTIFHHKEWSEFVPFICNGWAATSITSADGRQQTLSFLLPGDIVSAACLLEPMFGRTVEAITEVEYTASSSAANSRRFCTNTTISWTRPRRSGRRSGSSSIKWRSILAGARPTNALPG